MQLKQAGVMRRRMSAEHEAVARDNQVWDSLVQGIAIQCGIVGGLGALTV